MIIKSFLKWFCFYNSVKRCLGFRHNTSYYSYNGIRERIDAKGLYHRIGGLDMYKVNQNYLFMSQSIMLSSELIRNNEEIEIFLTNNNITTLIDHFIGNILEEASKKNIHIDDRSSLSRFEDFIRINSIINTPNYDDYVFKLYRKCMLISEYCLLRFLRSTNLNRWECLLGSDNMGFILELLPEKIEAHGSVYNWLRKINYYIKYEGSISDSYFDRILDGIYESVNYNKNSMKESYTYKEERVKILKENWKQKKNAVYITFHIPQKVEAVDVKEPEIYPKITDEETLSDFTESIKDDPKPNVPVKKNEDKGPKTIDESKKSQDINQNGELKTTEDEDKTKNDKKEEFIEKCDDDKKIIDGKDEGKTSCTCATQLAKLIDKLDKKSVDPEVSEGDRQHSRKKREITSDNLTLNPNNDNSNVNEIRTGDVNIYLTNPPKDDVQNVKEQNVIKINADEQPNIVISKNGEGGFEISTQKDKISREITNNIKDDTPEGSKKDKSNEKDVSKFKPEINIHNNIFSSAKDNTRGDSTKISLEQQVNDEEIDPQAEKQRKLTINGESIDPTSTTEVVNNINITDNEVSKDSTSRKDTYLPGNSIFNVTINNQTSKDSNKDMPTETKKDESPISQVVNSVGTDDNVPKSDDNPNINHVKQSTSAISDESGQNNVKTNIKDRDPLNNQERINCHLEVNINGGDISKLCNLEKENLIKRELIVGKDETVTPEGDRKIQNEMKHKTVIDTEINQGDIIEDNSDKSKDIISNEIKVPENVSIDIINNPEDKKLSEKTNFIIEQPITNEDDDNNVDRTVVNIDENNNIINKDVDPLPYKKISTIDQSINNENEDKGKINKEKGDLSITKINENIHQSSDETNIIIGQPVVNRNEENNNKVDRNALIEDKNNNQITNGVNKEAKRPSGHINTIIDQSVVNIREGVKKKLHLIDPRDTENSNSKGDNIKVVKSNTINSSYTPLAIQGNTIRGGSVVNLNYEESNKADKSFSNEGNNDDSKKPSPSQISGKYNSSVDIIEEESDKEKQMVSNEGVNNKMIIDDSQNPLSLQGKIIKGSSSININKEEGNREKRRNSNEDADNEVLMEDSQNPSSSQDKAIKGNFSENINERDNENLLKEDPQYPSSSQDEAIKGNSSENINERDNENLLKEDPQYPSSSQDKAIKGNSLVNINSGEVNHTIINDRDNKNLLTDDYHNPSLCQNKANCNSSVNINEVDVNNNNRIISNEGDNDNLQTDGFRDLSSSEDKTLKRDSSININEVDVTNNNRIISKEGNNNNLQTDGFRDLSSSQDNTIKGNSVVNFNEVEVTKNNQIVSNEGDNNEHLSEDPPILSIYQDNSIVDSSFNINEEKNNDVNIIDIKDGKIKVSNTKEICIENNPLSNQMNVIIDQSVVNINQANDNEVDQNETKNDENINQRNDNKVDQDESAVDENNNVDPYSKIPSSSQSNSKIDQSLVKITEETPLKKEAERNNEINNIFNININSDKIKMRDLIDRNTPRYLDELKKKDFKRKSIIDDNNSDMGVESLLDLRDPDKHDEIYRSNKSLPTSNELKSLKKDVKYLKKSCQDIKTHLKEEDQTLKDILKSSLSKTPINNITVTQINNIKDQKVEDKPEENTKITEEETSDSEIIDLPEPPIDYKVIQEDDNPKEVRFNRTVSVREFAEIPFDENTKDVGCEKCKEQMKNKITFSCLTCRCYRIYENTVTKGKFLGKGEKSFKSVEKEKTADGYRKKKTKIVAGDVTGSSSTMASSSDDNLTWDLSGTDELLSVGSSSHLSKYDGFSRSQSSLGSQFLPTISDEEVPLKDESSSSHLDGESKEIIFDEPSTKETSLLYGESSEEELGNDSKIKQTSKEKIKALYKMTYRSKDSASTEYSLSDEECKEKVDVYETPKLLEKYNSSSNEPIYAEVKKPKNSKKETCKDVDDSIDSSAKGL